MPLTEAEVVRITSQAMITCIPGLCLIISAKKGYAPIPAVTEPPKSLGPPIVVLVQRTSDNPVGAPELLDKFGILPYLTRNVSPIL